MNRIPLRHRSQTFVIPDRHLSRWPALAFCSFAIFLAVNCLAVAQTSAQDKTWVRYPSISPDGSQIAFSYLGDIWAVSSKGGSARMITSHEGYERSPVWSPDGKSIAFMADWNDGGDVYLAPTTGGPPVRLTFHSSGDEPTAFTPDGKHVLFTSRRQDHHEAMIGTAAMSELYSIPVEGGRPVQVMTTPAEGANMDADGNRLVFHDFKGFEDSFRKHHTSSVTRDVWMFDVDENKYTKLSGFAGEDRNPVWAPGGQKIYFLSEQVQPTAPGDTGKNQPKAAKAGQRVIPQLESTYNIWELNTEDPSQQKQITTHDTHPVRFLSISRDGTLCYGFNGQVFTIGADGAPSEVKITLRNGLRSNAAAMTTIRDSATEFEVSPNEEEVAFIVRGEVFVANVEFGTTRRVTNTPEQERSVTWGEDNRTLYYAGERNESWNLYKSSIDREDETGFANSTIISESPVLEIEDETFQPVCSPDGKQLAYLKNRTEILVLDLESGDSKTVVPAKKNFSYTDGDISYAWSGDSAWLTMTYHGHENWITEIGAVNVKTGEITNITDSGYSEGNPMFAKGGQAILYASDRYGEKSHGSWGGENDVIAVYLTQAAYDEATLDKAELALKKKQEKARKKKEKEEKEKKDGDKGKKKDGDKDADEDEDDEADDDSEDADKDDADKDDANEDEDEDEGDDKKKVEPIEFETDDLDLRRRRMTLHSSALGSFDLSPDGEHLLYTAQVDDKWALWLCKVRDRSTSNVLSLQGPSAVHYSKDGKNAFLMQNGKLAKIDLAGAKGGGKAKSKPIAFAAEMTVDGPGEREYIFEHAWRQVKRKFYDEGLHGVDWDMMKQNYAEFLPTINNNYDFAELLSEMLGELNASHTGARFRPRRSNTDSTAAFGLLYDVAYDGVGLKVAEVIERGPCDSADCKIKPGAIITHLNGTELTTDVNPWKLMNHLADKAVRLTLKGDEEWEEVIRPISTREETNLLYERWIANCRKLCEELSDGKIGYVHVRGMNDGSFRRVYSEVLGTNNEKKALIVDTRFNGGGWLHEDLATFLDGETYCQFAPRGFEDGGLGGEPLNKWTKPVVVLQSESNYSDAHFFPWAFKVKGVGKLVGAPVPGTATAVWWESQINPAIVFGIPQVGMVTNDGKYLENNQLEPDVLVLNDPQSVAAGKDPQMEKAVEVLLKDLQDN